MSEPKKPGPLGEPEYLAKEADDAKRAMVKAYDDLKRSLLGAGDVRQWTKQYPWYATGAALVAGLAAGYVVTPRDRDEMQEMLEKLKAKFTSPKTDNDAVYVDASNGKTAPHPGQPSLFQTLAREAIKAVVPLVSSMIGGAMGSGEAAEHAEHDGATPDSPAV